MNKSNSTFKRILSMILVTMIVLGAVPLSAFAATHGADVKNQVTVPGGSTKADIAAHKDMLSVSKTAEQGASENLIDVTLQVETNAIMKDIPSSAAVVLVMDMSNSMEETLSGGETNDTSKMRVTMAKAAAQDFVTTYAKDANGLDQPRLLSVVQFGTNAKVVGLPGATNGWVNFGGTGGASATTINSKISTDVKVGFDGEATGHQYVGHTRFEAKGATNMSGGLQLANNLLLKLKDQPAYKDIENLYVILLTDGKPTAVTTTPDSTSLATVQGQLSNANSSSWLSVSAVETQATRIKDSRKATLYSIGYTTSNTKLDGDTQSTARTLNKFLTDISHNLYAANDTTALSNAFKQIVNKIYMDIKAWTVEDPLAPFMKFKGITSNQGTDTAYEEDGVIHWNLVKDTPVGGDLSTNTKKTFTLTYQIEIDNQADGFVFNQSYPINTRAEGVSDTTLVYSILNKETGAGSESFKQKFPTPEVEAYCGEFDFTKLSWHLKTALEGATFTLTDNGPFATSGKDGKVSFTKAAGTAIPSGHNYKMNETVVPTGGYVAIGEHKVEVSWGRVLVRDKANEIVFDSTGEFASKSGFEIANKIDPQNIPIVVEKSFVGEPGKVTIELHRKDSKLPDNETYKSVVSKEIDPAKDGPGPYTLTFDNMPIYNVDTGNTFEYWVEESGAGSATYTAKIGNVTMDEDSEGASASVLNIPTEKKNITITKEWLAPQSMWEEVTIQVMNGTKVAATVVLPDGDNWFKTIEVPVYDELGEITYSIVEIVGKDELKGFDAPSYPADKSYTVVNKVTQQWLQVVGQKAWIDGDLKDELRPKDLTTVMVTLTRSVDGVKEDDFELTTNLRKDGTFVFPAEGKLPRYDDKGNAYVYRVTDNVDGYTVSDVILSEKSSPELEYHEITNSANVERSYKFEAVKIWKDDNNADGERPATIKVNLRQVGSTEPPVSVTLGLQNPEAAPEDQVYEWEKSFPGTYPMYDSNHKKIKYELFEEEFGEDSNYSKTHEHTSEPVIDGNIYTVTYTVTNTLGAGTIPVSVPVTKEWVGPLSELPDSVTLQLVDPDGVDVPGAVITLYKSDFTGKIWSGTFTDLPRRSEGTKIDYSKYTVRESYESGLEFTMSTAEGNNFYLTNTVVDEKDYVVMVEKVWANAPNADRPTVLMELLQDGTKIDSAEITPTGSQIAVFDELPIFDIAHGGERFVYSAAEDTASLAMPGYSFEYSPQPYTVENDEPVYYKEIEIEGADKAFQFTNAMVQKTTAKNFEKRWKYSESDTLPEFITVELTKSWKSGNDTLTETLSQKVYPDENGKWIYSFEDLPLINADDAGQPYSYSFEEIDVDGFTGHKQAADGHVILNISNSLKIDLAYYKAWIGPVAMDKIPIEITRTANGQPEVLEGEHYITEQDGVWVFRLPGQDMFDSTGAAYSYSFRELFDDSAYEAPVYSNNGTLVTNRIKQQKISVTGEKVWAEDVENIPESLTIYLMAGTKKVDEVTINASDWTFKFEGLDKYDLTNENSKGEEIVYTVQEAGESNRVLSYVVDGKLVEVYDVDYSQNENGHWTITNSHSDQNVYSYKIIRNYTYIHHPLVGDPVKYAPSTPSAIEKTGKKGDDVSIDPIKVRNAEELDYSDYDFVDGTIEGDKANFPNSVVLEEGNHVYVIVLNYEKHSYETPKDPDPDIYSYQIIRNYNYVYTYLNGNVSTTLDKQVVGEVVQGVEGAEISVDPDDYRSYNSRSYSFVDGDVDGAEKDFADDVTVTLVKADHTYVITLNYERTGKESREPFDRTPRPTPTPDPTPIVDIIPGPTPIIDVPDPVIPITAPEIIILEPDVPLDVLPKTGYEDSTGKNGFFAALSMGLLTLAAALGLRKEEEGEAEA